MMAFNTDRERLRASISPSELDGKKRSRCSNFTSQEKNILIHIIEKYQDIIECKKTDKVSCIERERVWEGIAREFNETLLTEPTRTSKQLKNCYENLKRKIRRDVSTEEISAKVPKPVVVDPVAALKNEVRLSCDGDSNSSTVNHQRHNSCPQASTPVLETGRDGVQFLETAAKKKVGDCTTTQDEEDSELLLDISCPVIDGSTSTQKADLDESFSPAPSHQPLRRKSFHLTKLKRQLLTKELQLMNMDMEMKAKKHELEMMVEQAKLEYYRKKTAILDNRANQPSCYNCQIQRHRHNPDRV